MRNWIKLLILPAALAFSCHKDAAPVTGDWPLDFHMPIDPVFKVSGGLRPSGEGSLFFLKGDEPDLPRLVVARRRVEIPPDQFLEEDVELGANAQVLSEGEIFTVQAINASGLGLKRLIQPFPAYDSTLTLAFDTRVFVVGPWTYSFTWQQVPEDSALATAYASWIRRLRFLPGAMVDSVALTEDAEDGELSEEAQP